MRRKLDNQGSHRPPSDPASDEFIFTALVTSLDTTFAVGRINQGSWCKTLKHWWVFSMLPSFSMLPLSTVSVLLQGSASLYRSLLTRRPHPAAHSLPLLSPRDPIQPGSLRKGPCVGLSDAPPTPLPSNYFYPRLYHFDLCWYEWHWYLSQVRDFHLGLLR